MLFDQHCSNSTTANRTSYYKAFRRLIFGEAFLVRHSIDPSSLVSFLNPVWRGIGTILPHFFLAQQRNLEYMFSVLAAAWSPGRMLRGGFRCNHDLVLWPPYRLQDGLGLFSHDDWVIDRLGATKLIISSKIILTEILGDFYEGHNQKILFINLRLSSIFNGWAQVEAPGI